MMALLRARLKIIPGAIASNIRARADWPTISPEAAGTRKPECKNVPSPPRKKSWLNFCRSPKESTDCSPAPCDDETFFEYLFGRPPRKPDPCTCRLAHRKRGWKPPYQMIPGGTLVYLGTSSSKAAEVSKAAVVRCCENLPRDTCKKISRYEQLRRLTKQAKKCPCPPEIAVEETKRTGRNEERGPSQ
ncbi:uncharacterized protein LOC105697331 [Orussus abietinus]|uniref:uncharacterized protein LOC105697331 n=1 Tax=Orussus abietinus TaxID=222816 RepID=UPI000626BA57|nr:uncharacterized protein LOC105697331 [Orussus abietinus]XP_012275990.1 uncharacterized protein LOC105697331 [Orussus abietinus]